MQSGSKDGARKGRGRTFRSVRLACLARLATQRMGCTALGTTLGQRTARPAGTAAARQSRRQAPTPPSLPLPSCPARTQCLLCIRGVSGGGPLWDRRRPLLALASLAGAGRRGGGRGPVVRIWRPPNIPLSEAPYTRKSTKENFSLS